MLDASNALSLACLMTSLGILVFAVSRSRKTNGTVTADEAVCQGGLACLERLSTLSQEVHALVEMPSLRFVHISPVLEEVLGHSREPFLAQGLEAWENLLHPADRDGIVSQFSKFVARAAARPGAGESELIQEHVYRVRDHWNDYRWFKVRQTVLQRRADGSIQSILVTGRDLTEQRNHEESAVQAQELESLVFLSRRVAHDLNNVLMGIQGQCELDLERGLHESATDRMLNGIHTSVRRATHLCGQLLAFTGQGRVRVERMRLNDAVREALPFAESLVPKNLQISIDLEPNLPPVSADLLQTRFAMLHMIRHCIHASGAHPGEITIRTSRRWLDSNEKSPGIELSGACAALEICHAGPTSGEKSLSGISVGQPGNGVGMLALRNIAREHHGAFRVWMDEACGNTFSLYLPFAEHGKHASDNHQAFPSSAKGHLVLLVDDEPTIRSILRQGLETSGYAVIEASDGINGLASFVRHRASISCVLLDLTMPRMNGDDVYREIRRLSPHVPVILMSGYGKQEALSSIEGTIAGFVHKPCSVKDVLTAVQKALEVPALV